MSPVRRSHKVASLTTGLAAGPRREAQETKPTSTDPVLVVAIASALRKTPATPVFFSLQ